jgi:hypothetical protein
VQRDVCGQLSLASKRSCSADQLARLTPTHSCEHATVGSEANASSSAAALDAPLLAHVVEASQIDDEVHAALSTNPHALAHTSSIATAPPAVLTDALDVPASVLITSQEPTLEGHAATSSALHGKSAAQKCGPSGCTPAADESSKEFGMATLGTPSDMTTAVDDEGGGRTEMQGSLQQQRSPNEPQENRVTTRSATQKRQPNYIGLDLPPRAPRKSRKKTQTISNGRADMDSAGGGAGNSDATSNTLDPCVHDEDMLARQAKSYVKAVQRAVQEARRAPPAATNEHQRLVKQVSIQESKLTIPVRLVILQPLHLKQCRTQLCRLGSNSVSVDG